MKVLVTGSQGTLGRPLVRELESRGHDVWGCDLQHGEKKEIRADVAEARQLERVFSIVQPEICYHLAAEFGRKNGEDYPEQLWRSNCIGTRNVIDACVCHKTFLAFASSSEAYGDGADLGEMKEDILLSHVPNFHNEYALTKWTNEKQIQIAIRHRGLDAAILRFFNAYGPGEEYNDYRSVVCLFIYRMMKGLPITAYRDYHRAFMYVDDWARTVSNCTNRMSAINGEAINISGTEDCEMEELVKKIFFKLGRCSSQVNYLTKEEANVVNKRPSVLKAQTLLDHRCDVGLDEGLDRTIAWMKKFYG